MPTYLTGPDVLQHVWTVPALALLVGSLLGLLGRDRRERRAYIVTLCAFALLGGVTGVMAGNSRDPAVPMVIPAVLSLVGGMAIYLIGRGAENRGLVALCIVAMTLTLWVGGLWGARIRYDYEEYKQSEEYLRNRNLVERAVRRHREELGLPASGPWTEESRPSGSNPAKQR